MTAITTALALYVRVKAQFHQLTNPVPLAADQNHLARPIEVVFPLHDSRVAKRRRPYRLLTAVISRALRSVPAPPPVPSPPAAEKPSCRLCAAAIA